VIAPTQESVLGLTPGRQMHSEIMALLRFISATNRNAYIDACLAGFDKRADIASDQVRLGYTS